MITREQAARIAQLVRTVRPSWDELAIINALAEVRDRDLVEVTCAALRAARNPVATSPRFIVFDGPHWRNPTNGAALSRVLCRVCWHPEDACRRTAAKTGDPHEWSPQTVRS